MTKVYISHSYSGKEENKQDIERIARLLVKKFPNIVPVSPVHTYGYLYNDVDYDRGLDFCIELLKTCDCMWVFGDYSNSKGVHAEIDYCEKHGIEYAIWDSAAEKILC